jgi:hypothetical protein
MKDLVPSPDPYDSTRLETLHRSPRRSLNAVHDTFDLMGGVPRLMLWADANPTDFYTKIWNRTLQTNQQVEHSGEITIRAAIGPGPLDDVIDVTPEPIP